MNKKVSLVTIQDLHHQILSNGWSQSCVEDMICFRKGSFSFLVPIDFSIYDLLDALLSEAFHRGKISLPSKITKGDPMKKTAKKVTKKTAKKTKTAKKK